MCSVCGIFGENKNDSALTLMNGRMCRRGPDSTGFFGNGSVSLGHNRLAVMDLKNGKQPMSVEYDGTKYTIVYNGEIYNRRELNEELKGYGIRMETDCDTETVLWSYAVWKEKAPEELNGIFAFAVYDEKEDSLFLCRDRLGVKPLYYAETDGVFVFGSEIKSLLAYPGIRPEIDRAGLWELLFLTPVTMPESGTFRMIKKVLPAQWMKVGKGSVKKQTYWKLEARPFYGTREDAVANVRELMTDAVNRQLDSDVPLCTLLSGGLDSSVITALAVRRLKERGEILSTYSFEYEGNRDNFKQSLFQPESDDRYASWLAGELGTKHTVLTASSDEVERLLTTAVDARDLPGQADIDSSLLGFCAMIKCRHTVALSGECSDEIFGGYPWFYRPEMLSRPFFPWLHKPMERIDLFDPSAVSPKEGYEKVSSDYRDFIANVSLLETDNDAMKQSRIATQLSVWYFMQSLLERKDRMSMYHALEVRVPFADHRILEYVYNVPWEYKFENGVEKSLLRNAMRGVLPEKVLFRKKSPYPKTHDPKYEELTRNHLLSVLNDPNNRLKDLLDKRKLNELIEGEDVTWFGQLMSRPQMYAWLIQLEYWLQKYDVQLV